MQQYYCGVPGTTACSRTLARLGQTDDDLSDLSTDRSSSSSRAVVKGHADYTGPTRQHEIYADRTKLGVDISDMEDLDHERYEERLSTRSRCERGILASPFTLHRSHLRCAYFVRVLPHT